MIASGTTAATTTMNRRRRRGTRVMARWTPRGPSRFPWRSRLRPLEGPLEALLHVEGIAPAIARSSEALGRVRDAEVERVGVRELFPGERHGNGRPWLAARRVGDIQRLAAHVHVVVHEELA